MPTTDSASRRQVIVRGVGIALLASLWLAILSMNGAFEMFDLRLLDWRFRLRGERPASDAIALVVVDDPTIRGYKAWPIPREHYALLLAVLSKSGARVIAVELLFDEYVDQNPEWNSLLATVTEDHRNIVHAMSFHAGGTDQRSQGMTADAAGILRSHSLPAGDAPAPAVEGVTLPFPELLAAAGSLGSVSVAVDQDGITRQIPMWLRYQDRLYPSMALSAYGRYHGWATAERIRWSSGSADVQWPGGARTHLPLTGNGTTAIDFAGDRRAFRSMYSLLEVLQWSGAGDSLRLKEAFSGRIVLVGLASQSIQEDVGTTPFAAATPLLYMHANAIDNLLRHRFLSRPPSWLYVLSLIGVGALLGWWFSVLSIPRGALVMGLTVAGIAAADQLLLSGLAIDVAPTAALALAPVVFAGIGTHRYLFLERRAQQREADIREGRSVQQRFLPEALVGQRLSHYDIVEKLGAGGMGVVYRGRDIRLGRIVAVKVLTGASLADEVMRRRFRREALALSRLQHPSIAALFDFDSQDGTDFLVMEFVAGTALSDVLSAGPLSEPKALSVAMQVAEALEAAHAHSVLHRDLKPANVVLTSDGKAKVLDVGIATMLDVDSTVAASLTESGPVMGTLAYMAPELLVGAPADGRADIYGLGMVMFEMLTGVRPFPDDQPHELMYLILNQPPPEPRVLNARISTRAQAIILRALEKEPEQRFSSAREMLDQLREAAAALPGAANREVSHA